MMRRILCIATGTEGYGVRQVWTDLMNGFIAKGDQVTIAVLDPQHAAAWQQSYPHAQIVTDCKGAADDQVPKIPLKTFYRTAIDRARQLYSQFLWLSQFTREFKPDCILFQLSLDAPLAGILAKKRCIPAYWFVPNYISTDKPLDINRRIYRLMFRALPITPVSNSAFTDRSFGQGGFERHVVHLGVDTKKFFPARDQGQKIRRAFGIPTTAVVIGLHARMTSSKGQARLVEAVAQAGLECHLLFCGGPTEGPYFETLKERIETLSLSKHVHFAGFQSDLCGYYAACDMTANLRDVPEAFGLSVVESMACGVPVLAHSLGGPSETILDGTTGWLIDDWGVSSIAAGLIRAFAQRDKWPEMCEAARAHVQARFTIETFHENALSVIENSKSDRKVENA